MSIGLTFPLNSVIIKENALGRLVVEKRAMNEKDFIWNDVRITSVYGRFREAPYTAVSHSHSQYELFAFSSAQGYVFANGKKFKIQKNSLIIIPPHTEHSVEILGEGAVSAMTVRFALRQVKEHQRGNDKLYPMLEKHLLGINSPIMLKSKVFGRFCDDFIEECEPNPLFASLMIKHLFEGLFIEMLRVLRGGVLDDVPLYSYKSTALSNDLVVAIRIDEFMGMPDCTLSSLSGELKMSTRNIQRIIRNAYNMSFSERMSDIRISRAVRLIESGEYSMTEVAEMSNYNRYDSFRKAFIAKMGISPTEYKQKIKKEKEI